MNIKQLCLAVLHVGEASGYEIRKALADDLASFQEVSFGALYPALKKLVDEGLATRRTVVQQGVPDKNVYEITPLGRSHFIDAVATATPTYHVRSNFLMQLIFADEIGPERLREIMLERLADFESRIEKVAAFAESDCCSRDARERMSRFCYSSLMAQRDALRDEIARLDNTLSPLPNHIDGTHSCAG